MYIRTLWAAVLSLAVVAACATTPKEEEPKVEASSEIIYEETPNNPAAADPFHLCESQQNQGATVLTCGNVVGVYIEVPQAMSQAQVDQNFEQFQTNFPKESTRERFTQQFGPYTATGMRVFEDSQAAPFRAELLIIPITENFTRVLSCAVRGSTDWTRCGRLTEALAVDGLPEKFGGKPAGTEMGTGADAGTGPGTATDGGMGADAGAGMGTGTGTGDGAVDGGTPGTGTRPGGRK